jgi:predicted nucleic acid-binding protein
MQVSKWGNSLAVRLPKKLVEELGIAEGDDVNVTSADPQTHEAALRLARDHGLAFYGALIVAAALEAGCDTLFTEDMQHGRKFGSLTIINPFI